MRHVTSATPVVLSGALVVPAGLLRTLRGEPAPGGSAFSTDPEARSPEARHIEVKGRVKGAATVTVTRNEILYGLNQQDKFILAIVLVDGDKCEGPFYVTKPFTQEPDWAVSSINFDLQALLEIATTSKESL